MAVVITPTQLAAKKTTQMNAIVDAWMLACIMTADSWNQLMIMRAHESSQTAYLQCRTKTSHSTLLARPLPQCVDVPAYSELYRKQIYLYRKGPMPIYSELGSWYRNY